MDYEKKAKQLIEKDDPYIYDVAVNMFPAQIVGNVKHTTRFREAVIRQLKEDERLDREWKRRKSSRSLSEVITEERKKGIVV